MTESLWWKTDEIGHVAQHFKVYSSPSLSFRISQKVTRGKNSAKILYIFHLHRLSQLSTSGFPWIFASSEPMVWGIFEVFLSLTNILYKERPADNRKTADMTEGWKMHEGNRTSPTIGPPTPQFPSDIPRKARVLRDMIWKPVKQILPLQSPG